MALLSWGFRSACSDLDQREIIAYHAPMKAATCFPAMSYFSGFGTQTWEGPWSSRRWQVSKEFSNQPAAEMIANLLDSITLNPFGITLKSFWYHCLYHSSYKWPEQLGVDQQKSFLPKWAQLKAHQLFFSFIACPSLPLKPWALVVLRFSWFVCCTPRGPLRTPARLSQPKAKNKIEFMFLIFINFESTPWGEFIFLKAAGMH